MSLPDNRAWLDIRSGRQRTMLMPSAPESRTERPLTSSNRTMLAISGLAAIAMCYVFSLVAVVLLAVLLGGELVVLIAAARVGLASRVLPVVRRHASLLSIFLRSFWLKKGKDY